MIDRETFTSMISSILKKNRGILSSVPDKLGKGARKLQIAANARNEFRAAIPGKTPRRESKKSARIDVEPTRVLNADRFSGVIQRPA